MLKEEIQKSVEVIRKKTKLKPNIAIILGTGLGALANEINKELIIPYKEIPNFPLSTVETHQGELVFGKLKGKNVVAMNGRFHRYEGYSMKQITFPVRVMRALGAKYILISNAAGGINKIYEPGNLMIIKDHINLMGDNPLIGEHDDSLGLRYPDMSEPYDKNLISLAEKIAKEEDIKIHKGVYSSMTGPSLETAAEYRFLRTIGADAIGMSTVPEVIVAVQSGFKVLGISVITDKCDPDHLEPADIQKIIGIAKEAEPKLTKLMSLVVEQITI